MTVPKNASDGGGRPPRMEIFQAIWAMQDLRVSGEPFDLGKAVDWITEHGFAGAMPWVETEADFAGVDQILRRGLMVGVGMPVHDVAASRGIVEGAYERGVLFLNAQVHDGHTPDAEAMAKLEALYELCDGVGIPLYIETHRGRITQDLIRTVDYARRLPRMLFTLDASHYVVAGEVNFPDEDGTFNRLLDEIIARSACIHARVSNGEQVQVDIGDGTGALVKPFVRWWTSAYQQWQARSRPGDLFPFVCELGPRPYSIAAPAGTGIPEGAEISDRAAQALVLKRLAEEISQG
jgi:sugar phosphate isomerase/epimerase